jgi:acyl-[acyl-carrier-protein]-phospholipid O-acyltransferase / long-chain-fatty-acid--[acyl-carrier-protein] ligase
LPRLYDPADAERSVFDALLDAAGRYGMSKPALEDHERKVLTYRDVIRASFVLGRKFTDFTEKGERVAVLLPTSAGAALTFFGLHAFGRIPTMLNYSSGLKNLKAACRLAGVKTILSSHRFIAQARLEDVVEGLGDICHIVYLEDVRKTVGTRDKLFGLAAGAMPRLFRTPLAPNQAGVILFTSGSLAAPKGVVLTHANLCANSAQVAAHIELDERWTLFNPLPTFHCFGLTIGVVLPLLYGVKAFQYPSPLHTKIIPGLIKDTQASILLATDTFVNQYARSAEPDDLKSLSFVVCGAERVREETHNLMAERFGDVWVLEGYGATEAAPVIAANRPGRNRRGTVGHFMIGVEHKVEPIPGVPGDGRLFVRGPNVMAGYLSEDGRTVQEPADGWHDTGDVIAVDSDGFIRIVGRARRFAKIGGEMISLSAVEDMCTSVWPACRHAVVSIADAKKGERLVLITDAADATASKIIEYAQANGIAEMTVPRKIIKVGEVPLLGTGKTDYPAAQRIADAEV